MSRADTHKSSSPKPFVSLSTKLYSTHTHVETYTEPSSISPHSQTHTQRPPPSLRSKHLPHLLSRFLRTEPHTGLLALAVPFSDHSLQLNLPHSQTHRYFRITHTHAGKVGGIRRPRRRPEIPSSETVNHRRTRIDVGAYVGIHVLFVSGNRVRSLGILKSLLVHYFKKFSYATNVDVDDAWNLVGCLDTHFKICIISLFMLLYFVSKPCN
ncbi:hypothetical protein Hdeb2414_s0001g00009201 [Helianthus debilis subsp. tardiflorus]